MEDFVFASYLAAFLTALLLLRLAAQRHPMLKPSFFCLLFYNLQLQWSSAIFAENIYRTLPDAWDYFLIVQAFPLLALLLTGPFYASTTRGLLARIQADPFRLPADHRGPLYALGAAIVLTLTWYFSVFDWRQTGLYALLFDIKNAAVSRENSLKLLPDNGLRYAISIVNSSLIPLTAVLLVARVREGWFKRNVPSILLCLAGLTALVATVSLSGARAPAAMLLLTVFLALMIHRKKLPGPFRMALIVVVSMGVPVAVSMLRELSSFTWEGLVENYTNVLDRAFGRVIEDGIWHVDHAQRVGFFGWEGIGNLASLLGHEPVNIFNVVGFKHMPGLASASANTAFPIGYYACFGLLSLPFSLLLLCAADALVLVWARIAPPMLLPCVAVSLIASISFVSTFYTTVFFTFGLGVVPVVSLVLQRFFSESRVSLILPVPLWKPRTG